MKSEAPKDSYQHVVVQGLPYDRGFSHGQQAKGKILRNLEHYKQPGKLVPWSIALKIIQKCYIPGLSKYWPSGLEEMRGVAAGAGVDLEDIILLNARYDLSHISVPSTGSEDGQETPTSNGMNEYGHEGNPDSPSECTSAIILSQATFNGDVFTAQNWDMSDRLLTEDGIIYLEIHPDPSEKIPSMFLVTEAGQLCRSGMNSAGLGLTANSLQSSIDAIPLSLEATSEKDLPAIPPCGALRRLFLESSYYADGLKRVARTPRHVSCNLMLSTADNMGICLEVTPKRIFSVSGSGGSDIPYILHSNHFQTPAFLYQSEIQDTLAGGSSWYRGDRLEAGIRRQARTGLLKDIDLINGFQDHAGYPHSLCEHSAGQKVKLPSGQTGPNPYSGPTCTVSCVVYNLSKRVVKVCKGPPCEGLFHEFRLEKPENKKKPEQSKI